jgi:hypothetical protein
VAVEDARKLEAIHDILAPVLRLLAIVGTAVLTAVWSRRPRNWAKQTAATMRMRWVCVNFPSRDWVSSSITAFLSTSFDGAVEVVVAMFVMKI